MAVKIKIDEKKILATIDQSWETGREMVSAQVLRDCNEYCKEDTGMLIISSYIHSDLKKGRLIWRTPYAARQYYEIRTAYPDVNPRATWRWCEVAKRVYKEAWARMAQAVTRFYRR